MCEYCEKMRSLPAVSSVEGIDAYIAYSTLYVSYEYAIFGNEVLSEIEHPINYCLMCGRKLGGDER